MNRETTINHGSLAVNRQAKQQRPVNGAERDNANHQSKPVFNPRRLIPWRL
jgi:hypothetical protein